MYRLGKHRLFYCSVSGSQANVAAEIITPCLETSGLIEMTYFDNNLYYFDVVFTVIGSHVFTVYENGIKKHREILVVSNSSLILYP